MPVIVVGMPLMFEVKAKISTLKQLIFFVCLIFKVAIVSNI